MPRQKKHLEKSNQFELLDVLMVSLVVTEDLEIDIEKRDKRIEILIDSCITSLDRIGKC